MNEQDEVQLEKQCQGRFLAELLRGMMGEVATKAAAHLLKTRPDIAMRYQPMPAVKWREAMAGLTGSLASAVGAGCPEMFARQAGWMRSTFIARSVPADDLVAGLGALRHTLGLHVPAEDRALVDEYIGQAMNRLAISECQKQGCCLCTDTEYGKLAAEYLLAVLEGNRRKASELILGAAKGGPGRAGASVRDLYINVLVPVFKEVGRMWEADEIDIAEEHFATATTQMVMAQLYPLMDRLPDNGRTVVACTVEGNTHEVGVRMVADFFEMAGWRAIYLGQSVPPRELALAIADFGADVLAISACLQSQLDGVADTIAVVRSCEQACGVKVLVGGPGFAGTGEHWKSIGADGFAETFDEAVAVAQSLVQVSGKA